MWISQDYDGYLKLHINEPHVICDIWVSEGSELNGRYGANENWHNSLINLETHDYKIEDGILVRVSLLNEPTPRKHSELACKYFMDDTVDIQVRTGNEWVDNKSPMFVDSVEYREKPKTETVRFKNYINHDNEACTWHAECAPPNLKEWVGGWQEVEVTCND